jgi:UDP-N-acetylmuramoylalanine--D-glutamate ligase
MNFDGAKVTVMGLGRFGGGVGVTKWLVAHGAQVLVTDLEKAEALKDSMAQIESLVRQGSVTLRLGEHNVSDFTTCDVVVANPAVPKPWDNRFLRAASAAGVRVTTEIGLLVNHLPRGAVSIGITGSAGKSTTSAMVHHILKSTGRRVVLGGNIGGSLLGAIGTEIVDGTFVVLEVSSAMLHWMDVEKVTWRPKVGVLTNITNNHSDWHGSFEHYKASKLHLVGRAAEVLVTGERDQAVFDEVSAHLRARSASEGLPRLHRLSSTDGVSGLRLPGAHNRRNAAMAVAAACAADPTLSREDAIAAVRTFGGLPHRLQFVKEVKGARWLNDSKCTTPEAALLAVAAFEEAGECGASRVHLIAGGYDKGSDLSPVANLAAKVAGLYTIGKTGPTVAAKAKEAANGNVFECGDLDVAVKTIAGRVKPGDVVLLSTACASWDQFENYEKRGELFCRLVEGVGT